MTTSPSRPSFEQSYRKIPITARSTIGTPCSGIGGPEGRAGQLGIGVLSAFSLPTRRSARARPIIFTMCVRKSNSFSEYLNLRPSSQVNTAMQSSRGRTQARGVIEHRQRIAMMRHAHVYHKSKFCLTSTVGSYIAIAIRPSFLPWGFVFPSRKQEESGAPVGQLGLGRTGGVCYLRLVSGWFP